MVVAAAFQLSVLQGLQQQVPAVAAVEAFQLSRASHRHSVWVLQITYPIPPPPPQRAPRSASRLSEPHQLLQARRLSGQHQLLQARQRSDSPQRRHRPLGSRPPSVRFQHLRRLPRRPHSLRHRQRLEPRTQARRSARRHLRSARARNSNNQASPQLLARSHRHPRLRSAPLLL